MAACAPPKLAGTTATAPAASVALGAPASLKIGIVVFLSGASALPFGVPSRNATEVVVDGLNAGTVPAPYHSKGIGGVPISTVVVDEAGTTDKQVAELRRLVSEEKVDLVIGYISSANCLAVSPVAEELKALTVLFNCGTSQVFEEGSYKYVFRTAAHQAIDNIGSARYVLKIMPDVKTIGGINQNYAWGQDSWVTFRDALLQLKPDVTVTSEQFVKIDQIEFATEIAALQSVHPGLVHSSLWGGYLEAFLVQSTPYHLAQQIPQILTAGDTAWPRLGQDMPKGMIITARGPHGSTLSHTGALDDWFVQAYKDRFGIRPVHPSYHMAQAILGVKTAYEKAIAANGGQWPTQDQVIAAFEGLEFPMPGGSIKMALGKGHQAVEPLPVGVTGEFDPATGEVALTNVIEFPVECVNPPDGVKSADWIKQGFPGAKCP